MTKHSPAVASYAGEQLTVEFSGVLALYEEGAMVEEISVTRVEILGVEVPVETLPETLQAELLALGQTLEFENE